MGKSRKKKKSNKKERSRAIKANVVTIILFAISLSVNIYQFNDSNQYKKEIDKWKSLTDSLNFTIRMDVNEIIGVMVDGELKEVELPLPTMKVTTGFAKSRTLTLMYNEDIIKIATLPTQDFLQYMDEDISAYALPIGITGVPVISYGKDVYGLYYFLITEGMDNSKKIHAVNYVLKQNKEDNTKLDYVSGKIYDEYMMMQDFEEETNLYLFKKDFMFFREKLGV